VEGKFGIMISPGARSYFKAIITCEQKRVYLSWMLSKARNRYSVLFDDEEKRRRWSRIERAVSFVFFVSVEWRDM